MQKHLYQNQQGIALVEFALVLPLLILLFLGSVELSRYVQAQQKMDKLAHTLVDLVAQAPTISTADLDLIMDATQPIAGTMNFSHDGVVIISCVGYDINNALIVKWQYKGGGNLVRNSKVGTVGGAASLPTGFTLDSKDNVIVSEVFFIFNPMINNDIFSQTEFYRTAYYLPRLGALDALTPN